MRMRRIRNNKVLREMTQEAIVEVKDFIYPLFVVEGKNIKREIPSLVDQYQYSVDMLDDEIKELKELGIRAVILFGIPDHKDSCATSAFEDDGIIQRATREIKKHHPDFIVITDVCMCEYTDHGHCGILTETGEVNNDETIKYIAKIALSQARAGADVVAPSDMMDFRVRAIREELDNNGFKNIPIMSYAAKYASSYYGPFRDAAGSAPSFGDRKGYQMDFHNSDEAMKEVELDLDEDADFIIVKPALAYLDIVRRVKENFNTNLVVYNVSGEYAMIKEAVKRGILSENIIYENMIAMKRAGAKLIISYHAKEMAKLLKEQR